MATRSRIGIQNPDGSILSCYCHNDGYIDAPHGVGHHLATYFQTPEKARALIDMGDRSTLDVNEQTPSVFTDLLQVHTQRPPQTLGRIYGRHDALPMLSPDMVSFEELFEEFNYLYAEGRWQVCTGEKVWLDLVVAQVATVLDQ